MNAYDPGSPDVGGVGSSSSPDGTGNACQCGDVTGDGRVTSADGTAILAYFYSGTPLAAPTLCDAGGNGACDFDDYLAVTSALSSPPGSLQNCLPAGPANLPSSAPLYLQVTFDGLGRLTDQIGMLGTEAVSRSYTYDGLSRLKTATGPWEKAAGVTGNVQWTYNYDALGNLRTVRNQPNQNPPARAWSYTDPVRPRLLTGFGQAYQPNETITPTAFGEPATIDRYGQSQEQLLWNAQGKLYRDKNSTYSWDAFEQNTLVVTGPSGSQSSIVRVGDDFEYQIQSGHATKYISVGGVRIAALATSYTAFNASLPPALIPTLRRLEPLVAPVATGLLLVSLVSMLGIATRRRPPVWMSAPGVSALSLLLIALPYQARADATALPGGPGQFGRPAERFLAYLTDHLGSVRAVVNQNGIVVETRDYDPFGADISHVGTFSVQHRFTGQPADDQAGGLYNYGARFYNAKWGRFISPDEVTQGFDSEGLNPYSYAGNAPTSRTDPTGSFYVPTFSIPLFLPPPSQPPPPPPARPGHGGATMMGDSSLLAGVVRLAAVDAPLPTGWDYVLGVKVPISGGTMAQQAQVRATLNRIAGTTTGRELLTRLRLRGNSGRTLRVEIVRSRRTNTSTPRADAVGETVIEYNPADPSRMKTAAGDVSVTPERVLGHEIAHAADPSEKDEGKIVKIENDLAKELGDSRVRLYP